MHKIYEYQLAGKPISFEFGHYAEQAGGAVLVRYGETVVLVCATAASKAREGMDFFPLSVDFEEKMYAAGKIPGGFIKREGRPTEKAILTSRLIDRPIRPLFPKGMRHDVQVVATVLSVDTNQPPEVPAMIGSSVALCVSDIPFGGPTGSVMVGSIDGQLILNPDDAQREASDLHLVVSGTKDAVMMVEAGAKELPEDQMLAAILFAHENIKTICAWQEEMMREVGKEKREFPLQLVGEDITAAVRAFALEKVQWSFSTFEREDRSAREEQVKKETLEHFAQEFAGREREIGDALYSLNKEVMRKKILEDGIRPDGRALTQVRPIWCDVGMLPRTHGSALFTRGQTQALSVVTLSSMSDVQVLDGLSNEETKRYMHHYNFPPYSTGEAKMMRGAGRREIGHGALGERALEPMIPPEADFPYAIRVVSEAISSNGSTSQASVCGSTLALMDAGVPLIRPVAGVAMGLIKDTTSSNVAVLTDIQGLEDFLGDMDFKVAGTEKGITAIQMDIKIKGIDEPILKKALAQALDGRIHILGEMLKTLPTHREKLSKYAPKIISFNINPDKIREVIGSGGKIINRIIAETGVKIDIEDDGRVSIATADEQASAKARSMIEAIAKDLKVGDEFTGKVVRIMTFGAFVELAPGKDGMLHISKLSNDRVEKVEDVVAIGDELRVKVQEVDSQGRVNLLRADIVYTKNVDPIRRPPQQRDFDRRPPRRD